MSDDITMTATDLANWDALMLANPNLYNMVSGQMLSTISWNIYRVGWVELDKADR